MNAYHLACWGGHQEVEECEEEEKPLNPLQLRIVSFRETLIASLWLYAGETRPTALQEDSHEREKLEIKYK